MIKLNLLPVATWYPFARVYFIFLLLLKFLLFVTHVIYIGFSFSFLFCSNIAFLIWCSLMTGDCDSLKYLSWIGINKLTLGILKKSSLVNDTKSMGEGFSSLHFMRKKHSASDRLNRYQGHMGIWKFSSRHPRCSLKYWNP